MKKSEWILIVHTGMWQLYFKNVWILPKEEKFVEEEDNNHVLNVAVMSPVGDLQDWKLLWKKLVGLIQERRKLWVTDNMISLWCLYAALV